MSEGRRLESRRRRACADAELAGDRRRLLESNIATELDPSDALLLRVDAAEHRIGLARLAEAALAVRENAHLTQLKAPAGHSRLPVTGKAHERTPTTDGTSDASASGALLIRLSSFDPPTSTRSARISPGAKGKTQGRPDKPPLLREGNTQLNHYRRGS